MPTGLFTKTTGALCAAAAVLWSAGAIADPVADFYKGRNVVMLIGSGAGGGYDTYSRAMGRYMGKHIPGKPNIIAQNMQGAGSIKATNYLYNVAPKDGSYFAAVFNNVILPPIVGHRPVKFDLAKLNWIGSIGKQQNICVTWHKNPVKTFEQAKRQEVVVSATGATGNAAIFPRIFNLTLGTKFKVVTGYKATGARLAVERGETGGICGMSYQTLLASNPDWILKKKINILAQIGLKPHPALKGVPMILDMMKDPADRAMMELLVIPQEMGRPFAAPPGVPKARLAALRRAFAMTMKDPAFLKEAKRIRLSVEPIGHIEIERLVKQAYATPKEVIARARSFLKRSKKKKKK